MSASIDVEAFLDRVAGATNETFRLVGSDMQKEAAEASAAVAALIAERDALRARLERPASEDEVQRARELLAEAFSDAGAFSAADTLLRTAYVTDYKNVVALRAIVAALRQQPAPVVDDALADTQRAIIEAAERRGYERAKAEAPVVDDAMRELIEAAMDVPVEYNLHGEPDTPELKRFVAALARAQGVQA